MALNKNFDLGDISFGEKKEETAKVTEVVKEKQSKTSTVKADDKAAPEAKPSKEKETPIAKGSEEDLSSSSGVKLITNKKSLKTEHKNFLFDKELADQLKKVAKRTGLSENEVVSQILKQTLSQLLDD